MTDFPFTTEATRKHDVLPPARADVVVIGGGIMGVVSAWFLREKGLSVVLCEKGRVAAEQSSRNWGWVRQQGRDAAELPIMIESLHLWQGLSAAAGTDLGFRQTGVLYIANKPAKMAAFERWLGVAHAYGLDSRLLSAAEVLAMLPGAAGDWPGGIAGGLWTASDARAEPWVAVPALPGLTVATGLSCHGIGIGPGMGRVVADLVAGGDVGHDLTRFRFGRFSDGSKIEVGPTL